MADSLTAAPKISRSPGRPSEQRETPVKIRVDHLNFYYGDTRVLHDISVDLHSNQVSAFIGPSGCGKSTFLRTLNRMNDIIAGTRVEGDILIDGMNLYTSGTDVVDLRRRVGMVFQKSNPFPKSIFENVAYGIRINGMARDRADLNTRVEQSLKHAALWDEVKDRLHESALALSGGQQQRLCIARALAVRPEILLMDEPASALDPIATQRIEELIYDLKTGLHDRDRDAQHAAGSARLRLHGVLLARQAGGVRPHGSDLHDAERKADRGLHHGTIRLMERSHFQQELGALKERLLAMGGLAEDRVRTAMQGLVERDGQLIEDVLNGDMPLNELHIEIDDLCLKLLALHSPMAADLRAVMAAIKINSDLERVGDMAVNIGEAARRYTTHPPVKKLIDIPRMATTAQSMLRDALDSYVRGDMQLAQRVLDEDDVLDSLKTQVFRELLTYMLQDPSTIEPALDLILISRHLERIGDHATNIAEDVIFMVSGRDVRHHAAEHQI